MTTPTRYGLIGSGMMGQEHMRNVALLDGVRVSAIADLDETMRDQATHLSQQLWPHDEPIKTFAYYEELLDQDNCDAFIICVPNDLHAQVLRDVIRAKRPILIEKPLSITTHDCTELLAFTKHFSTPVWVAMEYRFMPPIQRLIHDVHSGVIGTPRMMAIREHRFPFLHKVGHWNRFQRRTGGTLVEKCCHFWDLMRITLQSNPVSVFASGAGSVNHLDEVYPDGTPDMIDHAFVIVLFANGTRANLDLCLFAEGSYWQEQVTITGDQARLEALIPGPSRFQPHNQERDGEIRTAIRSEHTEHRETIPVPEHILRAGDHHGSTFFQHQRFFDLVRGERSQIDVGLLDGWWSVAVGQAAEESIHSGQVIHLPEPPQ